MTELTAGMEAPDFTLESDAGTPVSLSALRGNGVVLYFYPKDNTAGCTTEAQGSVTISPTSRLWAMRCSASRETA